MNNQKPIKIVHADDDKSARELMIEYCREIPNLIIYSAENGQQAYQLVRQHKPDVLVTDFEMPVMNGGQLVDKLRNEGFSGTIISFNGLSKNFEPWRLNGRVNHSIEKPGYRGVVEILREYAERQTTTTP